MSFVPAPDFQVRRQRVGRKDWAVVEIDGVRWVPSFKHLYMIIKVICDCEDAKYDGPMALGRNKVKDFLMDCVKRDMRWLEIAQRHQLDAEYLTTVRGRPDHVGQD